jgi:hypothetical protein
MVLIFVTAYKRSYINTVILLNFLPKYPFDLTLTQTLRSLSLITECTLVQAVNLMNRFQMLEWCLSLMDEAGEDFFVRVTVLAGGAIISGDLIHPNAYYRAEAIKMDSLVVGGSRTASDFIEEIIKEASEKYNPSSQTEPENQDIKRYQIYLKNIKPIQCGVNVKFDGAFMALRIDAIDGFVLGGMT